MTAELRMYLNNQPTDDEQLDMFREIRVDQAIGMVTEAELEMELALDDRGTWTDMDTDFLQPFQRIRVEVKVNGDGFVPLIDGPVVGQRFELSATPNNSKLTLVVHDDSVLLNRDEAVELFEEQTASDIARQLFQGKGWDAEVDTVAAVGGTLERVVVQRGTAMQLLRELARRHGMFVYVKPGATPGRSIGVFVRPDLSLSDLPELLLIGAARNVNRLTIEFDALRPAEVRANSINVADQSPLTADAFRSGQRTLGDTDAHGLVTPGTLLLARTREEANDLEAATMATADHSSWVYTSQGEVSSDIYPAVLTPYRVISVVGAGNLSGDFLISQVTHILNDESYQQRFTLRRNARSESTGGGLPGGIF